MAEGRRRCTTVYTASPPPPTSSFLPSPVRLLGYPADPLSLHPVFRPGRGGEERSKLEETAIVLLGAKRRRRGGKKSGMARGRRLVGWLSGFELEDRKEILFRAPQLGDGVEG